MRNWPRRIRTQNEFREFTREIGVSHDWHEPDNQSITARVEGVSFDNAGFWPVSAHPDLPTIAQEMCVIFSRTEWLEGAAESAPVEDLAVVNLATLCAWASSRY